MLDEPHHYFPGDVSIRSSFNPFGEVVNGYQNETMTVGGFRLNHANHVDSPH